MGKIIPARTETPIIRIQSSMVNTTIESSAELQQCESMMIPVYGVTFTHIMFPIGRPSMRSIIVYLLNRNCDQGKL